ncbi:MAG: PhzF family phenazine biosynthesis isomerase [Candidatus Bathyarchaeota archaeon]|nr:MAG: PhzF family phenazine biosynthesis isomerase [Candidatus Bathyarchaeota archaeon]
MRKPVPRRIPIYQVDAFTDDAFKGNPAAVCILRDVLNDEAMQKIAAEMNLSETAFVKPLEKKPLQEARSFSLRWFAPKVEVSLCGHATLATAAVLFREVELNAKEIEFRTRGGNLKARKDERGICLNFPSDNPMRIDPPKPFLRAIGAQESLDVQYAKKMRFLLIHLPSEKAVHDMSPDFGLMESMGTESEIGGVIVTAESSPPYDFISRFFAPWVGIDEDPVTGAAHTVLGPYWSRRLNRREMKAYQASTRGGVLFVRAKTDDTVDLIGNAVLVLKGKLYLH